VKVLYVNHTAHVSGAERAMLELAAALAPDVEGLVACPPGELADRSRRAGLRVELAVPAEGSLRFHPVRTPTAVLNLMRLGVATRRIARAAGADVVHAASIRAGLAAALARRLGAPPAVVAVTDRLPPGPISRAVLRMLTGGGTVLVPNSYYTAQSLPPAPSRIQVVYPPVDSNRFDLVTVDHGTARDRLDLPDEVPVLALVAQITHWKGHDLAVRALAELRKRDVEAILVLVGSVVFAGPDTRFDNPAYERELHRLVGELGLEDRVRFLGQREDVPQVLAAADVALVPSIGEPFGRSAVEAMAMGVPVVAAAEGGPTEIIRDETEGVLVSGRDPEHWAIELARLLADRRRREEIAAAGRRRALDFRLERHASAMRAVYAYALLGDDHERGARIES
jgi:L-malate glycosyltransferase